MFDFVSPLSTSGLGSLFTCNAWLLATCVLLQQGPLTNCRPNHSTRVSHHVSGKLGSTHHDIRRIPGKPGTIRIKMPIQTDVTDYLDQTQGWERYSIVFKDNWTHGEIEDNGFTRRKMRKPEKYNKELYNKMISYMVEHMNFSMPPSTAEEKRDYEEAFIKRGNQTLEPPSCEVDWNRTGYDYYLFDERTTKWPMTSLHWLQNDSFKFTTSAEFGDIWHKMKLARIGNITFGTFPTMRTRASAHIKKLNEDGQFTLMESFDVNDIPTAREEDIFYTKTPDPVSDIELYPLSAQHWNDSLDPSQLPKENLTQYKGQFESAEEVALELADAFNISSEPLYSSEYFMQTYYKNQPTFSTPKFLKELQELKRRKKEDKKREEEEKKKRNEQDRKKNDREKVRNRRSLRS